MKKSVLQVTFFILLGIVYLLGFLLTWVGFYPVEDFGSVISKWSLTTPFVALFFPFIVFIVFALGYDPRVSLLRALRGRLLKVLLSIRMLIIACVILLLICLAQFASLNRIFYTPSGDQFLAYMDGDFTNVLLEKGASLDAARIDRLLWLATQSEIEARRRNSSSNDLTEIAALREELPGYDSPFDPIWYRFLANYSLGKIAYCRADVVALENFFDHAESLSKWLNDPALVSSCAFAKSQAYFSLARAETDQGTSDSYMNRAIEVANTQTTISSQRLLGAIYYTQGKFGDAANTWGALLQRDAADNERGLEIPGFIEKKKLCNNIALARLNQSRYNGALQIVGQGLNEIWDDTIDEHRTEQVRLMATKVLCLLALNRPHDALITFEERSNISVQIQEEGLSSGSALLKANIHAAIWRSLPLGDEQRDATAQEVLNLLLLAQNSQFEGDQLVDHTEAAYKGLVSEVASRWRWDGIKFNAVGCEKAILSLLPAS